MLRHELGLDQPLWKQFVDYVWQVLHGDLGMSVVTRKPVWSEFTDAVSGDPRARVCAMLFAVVIGVPPASSRP